VQRFNPPFADAIERIMIYSEDQGIRITAIGAGRYENMAIVYLSLQDVTGANRLTESLDFMDGFGISTEESDMMEMQGFSTKKNLLYFDEVTNTVYLEIQIASDTVISDPLSLGTFLIAFEVENFEHEPVLFSLADISDVDTIPITPHIANMSSTTWGLNGIAEPEEILLPGRLADMPTNTESHWISNIGILDGQLRVQIIRTMEEFGASGGGLSLITPEGEPIYAAFSTHIWLDQEFAPVDLNQYAETYGSSPPYYLDESVFNVNIDTLADYILAFTGRVTRGAEGYWRVVAYTADTASQVIALTNDIWVDGNLYEFMTLTPLGLQVMGEFTADRGPSPEVIYVEIANGLIPLEGGHGSFDAFERRFSLNWQTKSPLDVGMATAIIINDLRIPIT